MFVHNIYIIILLLMNAYNKMNFLYYAFLCTTVDGELDVIPISSTIPDGPLS